MPVLARGAARALGAGLKALGLAATLISAAHGTSHVYAARVAGGAVRVLFVTDGAWPAGGLRIEDGAGVVLAAHVAADPAAAARLDAASQNALAALAHPLAPSDPQASTASALLVLRVLSDFDFARAAGLATELPPGTHASALKVVLLDAAGAATATLGPIALSQDTGPPAATALTATAEPRGVILTWQLATRSAPFPAFAYSVERIAGAARESLTLHPQLLTLEKSTANPFIDHAPPVESDLRYELRLIDVLGVGSAPATVELHSPDFAAGAPPAGQHVEAGRNLVTLRWDALTNPRASGLMVERSQLPEGPYEWLTPQGLSPQTTRFEDHNVLPGARYYYRIRTVTPGAALGPPGDPLSGQALAPHALAAPQGLKAEVGSNQVVLTWKAVPGSELAGYIVERRAAASVPRWARLNTRLLPATRYLDLIGGTSGGSYDYRITAVATDEGLSPPSEVLHVALRDLQPPPAPIVLSASGADGHVVLHFAPAEPAAKTAQVALLRADAPAAAALVVGAPVSGAAGTISDEWVKAGQVYWYRLVALDAAGNRSEESTAYAVRVAAVALPAPAPPTVLYAAQPAPQMTIRFEPPPPHVLAIVQVELEDGRWRAIAGPGATSPTVDRAPPSAQARYRLVYVGESGGGGRVSEAVAGR